MKPQSNELSRKYNPEIEKFLTKFFTDLEEATKPRTTSKGEVKFMKPKELLQCTKLLVDIHKIINASTATREKPKDPRWEALEKLLLEVKDPEKLGPILDKLAKIQGDDVY